MAKKIFYSLSRCTDGIQYIRREGSDVPNNYGLDLAIYNLIDVNSKDAGKGGKVWHVVDVDCGLSIGSVPTRKLAIEKALDRLSKVNMETYTSKANESVEAFGPPPNKRIFYL